MSTREIGLATVSQKIINLGGVNVSEIKEGNKRFISFTALNGKKYQVSTRAKNKGTWQTTINYGEVCRENVNETKFWVFVDISLNEPKFYITPLWWIQNDIHKVHCEFLEKHKGHRPSNNDSTHHSISKKRIEQWEGAWNLLGLNA
ncbi:hypothetical protein M0C34_13870 [Agarivorans sp. TSD2052]|uniref:hypothetical protein n=1 Tax=Agarivorans sp. TSD2052 TaxID=2937286 RepID=UPI00200C85F9|nr:hypothetical protein [Agarivorans sp. TSD2052]UPW17326.1 hypothetical protein M0C34_13870 [Agarivorans sp. TSD2052]